MTTTSLPTLRQQPTMRLLPGLFHLARRALLRMWRMLVAIWLGLLCVIVLVCAGPLFSRVAITADLQNLATNAPDGSYFTVQASDPTPSQAQGIQQHMDVLLHHGTLAQYMRGEPQVILRTPSFRVAAPGVPSPLALFLDGYDSTSAARHAVILQGRLPHVTQDDSVEIALARDVADVLGVHIGSMVQGHLADRLASRPAAWNLRVVGLLAPQSPRDPYWLTCPDCSNAGIQFACPFTSAAGYSTLTALAVDDAILARQQDLPGLGVAEEDTLTFFWRYPVNFSDVGAADVFALARQISDIDADLAFWRGPDRIQVTMTGTLDSLLRHYWGLIVQLEAALTALEAAIVMLALVLLNLMLQMLVERQQPLIAKLRSRGATRLHVAGIFAAQGVVLLLAAVLLGPLVAVAFACALAWGLLPASAHAALSALTSAPIRVALDVQWYANFIVACGLVIFIRAASQSAILTSLRLLQHAARMDGVMVWQRLFVDLLGAVLALGLYVVYVVSWTQAATARIPPSQLYVVLTNLGLLVAPLPYAAAFLLFLRVLPWLLRLATFCASRLRAAPALLACARLEHAGRPAIRLIVLLALAISTGGFFVTLLSTMQQHTTDVATFYAEAADLSGPLPVSATIQSFGALQARYRKVQGVQSVTLGYQRVIQLDPSNPIDMPAFGQGMLTIDAVDADTYAHTARWSATYSAQPLTDLMAALITHRSDGIRRNVVYAFADAAACDRYSIAPAATMRLPANDTGTTFISYMILGCIHLIPGVTDAASVLWTGIGLLADYHNFAAVYAHTLGGGLHAIAPNHLWLRTTGDASADASLRASLPGIRDRRAMSAQIHEDAFHLDVVGVLIIGVGVALLLVLFGVLLTSWLTAANHRLSFAITSALGMAQHDFMLMVLYEQGLIYVISVLLGGILWLLLLPFTAPAIAFFTVGRGRDWDNNFNIPPIRTAIPLSDLALFFTTLAIIAIVATMAQLRQPAHSPSRYVLRHDAD